MREIKVQMAKLFLLGDFIVLCWLVGARGWVKKVTGATEMDTCAQYLSQGAPQIGYFQHVMCRDLRAARLPPIREPPSFWEGC